MAISTSKSFALNRDQIIEDALTLIGGNPVGQAPHQRQSAHAARILNSLVKSLDSDGRLIARIERRTLLTVAGQAQYTLGTDILDIEHPMSLQRSGETGRTPLSPLTRKDFMFMSNRTTSGTPTRYLVEHSNPNVVKVTFWPVPDQNNDSIEYQACIRASDFVDGSNNPDYPQRWARCLTYGLAADLCLAYKRQSYEPLLRREFDKELAKMINDNNERADLVVSPSLRWAL